MLVYAHFTRDGSQYLQAFNKPERAVDYAYNQIYSYYTADERHYSNPTYGKMPTELAAVKTALDALKNGRTIEQIHKLIEAYEDYCRVIGQESPLHSIRDIPLVE